MKLYIFSDIHNEFRQGLYRINKQKDENDSVLILAGDIGVIIKPETYLNFLRDCCNRFQFVIITEGNHEFYSGGNISFDTYKSIGERYNLSNLYTHKLIIEREKIVILSQTLWTDFNKHSPTAMQDIYYGLNDYAQIEIFSDYRPLSTEDIYNIHIIQKKKLFDDVDYYSGLGFKIICMTHHAPSNKSVMEKYKGSKINHGFYSELEDEILKRDIAYWIHGHMHDYMKYNIGETIVICNPKGYLFETDNGFNPNLFIEL